MSAPRVVLIVQARLGSVRLPGKVLEPILGEPALSHLLRRVGRCQRVDSIVLAVPDSPSDDRLARFGAEFGIHVHRGSEHDVLSRYVLAARAECADLVVRVTGDCPLVDPAVIDSAVEAQLQSNAIYVATDETFPDGFDVEVCTFEALERAERDAVEASDREHVMPFVRRLAGNSAVFFSLDPPCDVRVTLDSPEDLIVIRSVFDAFGHDSFSVADVASLASTEPERFQANRSLSRNWGATVTSGEKMWERAKKVIPGGSMLLSKRAEMFLSKGWPAYFSRAKGCSVWDLDGREFIDVGLMGVGTNILGYGDDRVDDAVRKVIDTGNMSTLNGPEEVYLAERLVELHPWAQMVRFARSGGEACAIAVRIARAYSDRDGVAVCGYHGWHDWYLAANLAEDSALDGHLLPGLEPQGVPRALNGTTHPFAYNDLEGLKTILERGDVGVIFTEVRRSQEPLPGYLQSLRNLATDYGAVLIFDECTSGFRRTLGGLHLDYGIEPDIVTLGKTLGNGYAVSAVVGREDVMQAAQSTFVSSTFWTERIGSAAGLAALAAMAEDEAPRRIDEIGRFIQMEWINIGTSYDLSIQISGLPSLSSFSIDGIDLLPLKTYITQELLKRGFLGSTSLYVSTAHTKAVLDRYLEALSDIFRRVATLNNPRDLALLLDAAPAHSGFTRLA